MQTFGTQKILPKLDDLDNLFIDEKQKESMQKHVPFDLLNFFSWAQSFCPFQQDQTAITREDPIGSTWHKH